MTNNLVSFFLVFFLSFFFLFFWGLLFIFHLIVFYPSLIFFSLYNATTIPENKQFWDGCYDIFSDNVGGGGGGGLSVWCNYPACHQTNPYQVSSLFQ